MTLNIDPDIFADAFLVSDTSRQFADGNPRYVAGMNGCELARHALSETNTSFIDAEDVMFMEKSPRILGRLGTGLLSMVFFASVYRYTHCSTSFPHYWNVSCISWNGYPSVYRSHGWNNEESFPHNQTKGSPDEQQPVTVRACCEFRSVYTTDSVVWTEAKRYQLHCGNYASSAQQSPSLPNGRLDWACLPGTCVHKNWFQEQNMISETSSRKANWIWALLSKFTTETAETHPGHQWTIICAISFVLLEKPHRIALWGRRLLVHMFLMDLVEKGRWASLLCTEFQSRIRRNNSTGILKYAFEWA